MQRLVLLDGMRGVAALAVIGFHLSGSSEALFAQAWLAVDFFFLLSGFVLARAYGERFSTMGFGSYMRVRVRRLYPAIIAGLALSVVLRLAMSPPDNLLWVKVLLAAAMLPFPVGFTFPLNGVQWSLMFEFVANALHALIPARALPILAPLLMLVGAALMLVVFANGGTLNSGHTLDTLWIGLGRTLFSFFAGVTLFGLYRRGAFSRVPRLPIGLIVGLFVLALALPTLNAEAGRDLVTIMLLWPLLLIACLGAPAPSAPVVAASRWLGWLSYPLYAIDMPIIDAIRPAVTGWGWPGTVFCCGVIVSAAALLARLTEPMPRSPARSFASAALSAGK